MKPGEYFLNEAAGPIEANVGRDTSRVLVRNTGDRPVQVGSHYPFLRNQSRARVRSRRGVRHAPEHSRRHRGALRAGRRKGNRADAVRRPPRDARLQRSGRRPARRRGRARSRPHARAKSGIPHSRERHSQGRADEPENSAPHLRRPLRPHNRRPHPPGRHRTNNRNRKRLTRTTATRSPSAAAK